MTDNGDGTVVVDETPGLEPATVKPRAHIHDPTMIYLHRDAPGTSRYLEAVAERIRRMAERWGGDGKGLAELIWTAFAARNPHLGVWAFVLDEKVVGHMLVDVRQHNGVWVVWVYQIEHDLPGAVSVAMRRRVLESVIPEWAAEFTTAIGAKAGVVPREILFETPRSAASWLRHSGFEEHMIVMRKALPRYVGR